MRLQQCPHGGYPYQDPLAKAEGGGQTYCHADSLVTNLRLRHERSILPSHRAEKDFNAFQAGGNCAGGFLYPVNQPVVSEDAAFLIWLGFVFLLIIGIDLFMRCFITKPI